MNQLVLSIFPGIGILDRGFEEEGFVVVRGPDLLWGGDIRKFHPPAGVFQGVIGGPPCQVFSSFAALNRAQGNSSKYGNLIPEFERIVSESSPAWFAMENVEGAPIPRVDGYEVDPALLNNRWLGGDQSRLHRFSLGFLGERRKLLFELAPLESARSEPRVLASSGGNRFPAFRSEAARARGIRRTSGNPHGIFRGTMKYFNYAKALQGLDDDFDLPAFTVKEKCRAIGNAVALPMARELARAIRRALGLEAIPRTSGHDHAVGGDQSGAPK